MAEFTYNPIQEIPASGSAIFNTTIGCNRGYVLHRPESALITLRGIVNNPCGRFARYKVTFNGNIAVPATGTAGAISVALAINGESIQTSNAIVTPAAVEQFFNVSRAINAEVFKPCGCQTVTVRNTSNIPILVQNANIIFSRPDLAVTR
jgi:hypothetical protein